MKQQTAVEWLKNNLPSLFIDDSGHYERLFEQAKQMEKQQIVDAIETGWVMGCSKKAGKVLHTEQYYKETYGAKKQ